MQFVALALLSGVLGASATVVPITSSDPVNSTIPAYTDGVLQAVAANPPNATSWATVNFTSGHRTLPGAYFHFTELAGTTSNNLAVLEIDFAFPSNLSSTNNIFAYHVHANPVTDGDDTCESAGPHYDPFLANGTEGLANPVLGQPNPLYNPTPANLSSYQLGDLAGKWGDLTSENGAVAPRTILENYLRLTGDFSIVGRAIVVHDAPTNTRIACGNIVSLATVPASWTTTASPSGTAAAIKPSTTTVSSTSGASSVVLHPGPWVALSSAAALFVFML